MNIVQTNDLLVHIQLIDNRQVGDATVLEWHELVGDLDYDEALEAVRLHFRDSTDYLKPAHVRGGIDRIRLAGLGPQQDEYGNDIEPDHPAVAAYKRLHPNQKAINS